MTIRSCSSPAPTRVKLQPAPAILSQESVHTTLSITHHTRKRPSTGPRTTHGPQMGIEFQVDQTIHRLIGSPQQCFGVHEHMGSIYQLHWGGAEIKK
jgi:hypothetical protein